MKFGQLIEYIQHEEDFSRKIKNHTKCGWETIPRPFSKNSKLGISQSQ